MSSTTPQAQKPNSPLNFLSLMTVMLLASLSQMVLSSALPTIVGELHGVELMLWVITAYMLTSTIFMPIYGKVSDLLGRRPVLIAAIIVFVAGSILGGLAPDMTSLIIARAIQGMGGGGLMIMSQAAIADVIPARDRGKYMGIMGGVFAFSSVAGPLLGGWITEVPGWRWAFWLNVPLGLLALLATFVLLKLPQRQFTERPKLDYLGMTLLAVLTTSIVLLGTWGGSVYPWSSPVILGLVLLSLVSIGLFILVEARAAEPIIPLSLFRDRNFNLATFSGLFVAIGMFGAVGYMPTHFQMASGGGATDASQDGHDADDLDWHGCSRLPGRSLSPAASGRRADPRGWHGPAVNSAARNAGLGDLHLDGRHRHRCGREHAAAYPDRAELVPAQHGGYSHRGKQLLPSGGFKPGFSDRRFRVCSQTDRLALGTLARGRWPRCRHKFADPRPGHVAPGTDQECDRRVLQRGAHPYLHLHGPAGTGYRPHDLVHRGATARNEGRGRDGGPATGRRPGCRRNVAGRLSAAQPDRSKRRRPPSPWVFLAADGHGNRVSTSFVCMRMMQAHKVMLFGGRNGSPSAAQ